MGMGDKSISIECEGAGTKELDEFNEFQGNLKELSEVNYVRFKKEILTEGFAFPIRIWPDPKDGKTKIMGGHQAILTLRKMRDAEGYFIPPIPYSIIHARDWKQAKRRVLQDISQYGKVTGQGLYEFVTHADISIEDLSNSFDIPDLNLESFKGEFFDLDEDVMKDVSFKAKTGSKELSEDDFQTFDCKCPKCGFEFDQ